MNKMTDLSWNAAPDRRTQRTRQALMHALMDLIQEKRYDSITIQDICDRANVGRSTFYAHYQDKDDLLGRHFQEVIANLDGQIQWRDGQLVFSITPLLQHVRQQHHLYRALVSSGGFEVLLRTGQKQWSAQIQTHLAALSADGHRSDIPPEVIAMYLAGVVQTMLVWWLEHKMPYSPEQMDEMFQQLVMPGLNAVL